MLRTSLTAFIALTLISSTAQASPYAGAVKIVAAPGYAAPGEAPPPAETAPAPAPAPQPYAQPQPYQEQEKPRRRGKGLMIAGWSMFGASYLTTAFIGAAVYDASGAVCNAGGGDSCRRSGLPLVIPVIGPLINIGNYNSDSISLTALGVFSFLVQAAGLSMGIAGTVLFVKDGKRNRAQQMQHAGLHIGRGVHLRAAPRLDGGSLNLSYRF